MASDVNIKMAIHTINIDNIAVVQKPSKSYVETFVVANGVVTVKNMEILKKSDNLSFSGLYKSIAEVV